MTSREDLLDRYINARNGREPDGSRPSGDPELETILETVDRVRSEGELEWPEDDFPARMSRNLRAELRAGIAYGDDDVTDTATPASDGSPTSPSAGAERLGSGDGERTRGWYVRQLGGMLAAAAVLGAFALGLAYILGGWGDEVSAPGAVVDPGQIPGTLLYTEYENGDQTIARIDADGTNQQNLASRHAPLYEMFDLAWSPDGERIAYFDPEEPDRDAPAEISIIDADGGEADSVDAGQFHGTLRLDTQLNWSYNGSSLAFAHLMQENERKRVSVVHPETEDIQTTGSMEEAPDYNDSHPAWAPDRWALAFSRNEGENQRSIQFIREGMSEPIPLVEDRPRANQPAWSPDGDSIVYIDSEEDEERSSIFTVDVDSQSTRRVTDHDRWDYSPAWSSRDQIAFMSDQGDRNYDIFVVEPDGSGLRNLTEDYDWPAYLPDWSDDGRYLAFSSHNQDQNRWRINVYDMDQDQLYTVLESENPLFGAQWRPDGSTEPSPEPTREVDGESEAIDPQVLDRARDAAERYLAGDESPVAATVNGREITAAQLDMQRFSAEQNLSQMREFDASSESPQMAEYHSRQISLIEEYGTENVALGAALIRSAILAYAEEHDLVASDEQVEDEIEQQREIMEQDAEFPNAVIQAAINALGEDVYWNEYLPESTREFLTVFNVDEAVWDGDHGNPGSGPVISLERDLFLADFRADLLRDAEIEVIDESALGEADLERAIEYVTEGRPEFQRSLRDLRPEENQGDPTPEKSSVSE